MFSVAHVESLCSSSHVMYFSMHIYIVEAGVRCAYVNYVRGRTEGSCKLSKIVLQQV